MHGVSWVFSSCGASAGFLTRYERELREPLVWRQGSQVPMRWLGGDGDLSLPLGLALGSPIFPSGEKDLESPSSTRLEALVTSHDSRAIMRSPSPCPRHLHRIPRLSEAPREVP